MSQDSRRSRSAAEQNPDQAGAQYVILATEDVMQRRRDIHTGDVT